MRSTLALLTCLAISAAALAEPKKPITVAVLDFAAEDADLGKQLGETVQILLSGAPGIQMVERANLTRVMQEAELNLSGLVEPTEAIKVGKLVGARIMVFGRAFVLGDQMLLTAKVVGTETSLVEGVLVKRKLDEDLAAGTLELARKVATVLQERGPALIAHDRPIDTLASLAEQLRAQSGKPMVAVFITETHIEARPAAVPDPAVETEIKKALLAAGFSVKDVGHNQLAQVEGLRDQETWPTSLDGVEYLIIGEAFSEEAARLGNLQVCSARAEINVIRRSDGKIVLADRTSQRGVDLARNVAGKHALQKSGYRLAVRVLQHFAGDR